MNTEENLIRYGNIILILTRSNPPISREETEALEKELKEIEIELRKNSPGSTKVLQDPTS